MTAPPGGLQANTAPVYRMPWGTMHPPRSRHRLSAWLRRPTTPRRTPGQSGSRAAFAGEKAKDDPFAKVRIAEAASDIDAAWRQLKGNLAEEYALLCEGKEVPMELRAQPGGTRCGRPAGPSPPSTGSSGRRRHRLNNDQALQRFWRDAHAGRVHAANDAERAYAMFGNQEFGLHARRHDGLGRTGRMTSFIREAGPSRTSPSGRHPDTPMFISAAGTCDCTTTGRRG